VFYLQLGSGGFFYIFKKKVITEINFLGAPEIKQMDDDGNRQCQ
jgi:hypothetical protein